LSQKHYVYWWADGIYFNVRLEQARPCVLVIVGALEDGTKALLALAAMAFAKAKTPGWS
jgi:transposase-like protein